MNNSTGKINSTLAVERLTALWALNEAGLGGLMHAIKTPFTGILVGGSAIIIITLIAHFSEKPVQSVLKALVIVLLIKLSVSPYSPLPAYFAVSFQGVLGALLFGLIKNYRVAALLLGVVGVVETAFQKVVVLTIIYGNALWESIDLFFNNVLQLFNVSPDFSMSFALVGLYVGVYFFAGIFIGWFAGYLPGKLKESLINLDNNADDINYNIEMNLNSNFKRKKKSKAQKFIIILIIVAGLFFLLAPAGSSSKGLYVIGRAVVILLTWYFIISPLMMKLLMKILKRKKSIYSKEIENVLSLLPSLKGQAKKLFAGSSERKGLKRWRFLIFNLLLFTLTYNKNENNKIKTAGSDNVILQNN